jgi:hypothetical protein
MSHEVGGMCAECVSPQIKDEYGVWHLQYHDLRAAVVQMINFVLENCRHPVVDVISCFDEAQQRLSLSYVAFLNNPDFLGFCHFCGQAKMTGMFKLTFKVCLTELQSMPLHLTCLKRAENLIATVAHPYLHAVRACSVRL